MGKWRIVVEGHGIHHNGIPADANAIAQGAVDTLVAAGHEVQRAEFALATGETAEGVVTGYGPADSLLPPPPVGETAIGSDPDGGRDGADPEE